MTNPHRLDDSVVEAIGKVEKYILEVTGTAPTAEELALALSRYFVMKEIADFVQMTRAGGEC